MPLLKNLSSVFPVVFGETKIEFVKNYRTWQVFDSTIESTLYK